MAFVSVKYRPAATFSIATHTNGDASPEEDFLTFFVKGNFTTTTYGRVSFFTGSAFADASIFDISTQSKAQPSSTLGLASILEVQNVVDDLLARDRFAGISDQERLSIEIAEKTWIIPTEEWQFLAIPKRAFRQVGNGFNPALITEMRFTFDRVSAGDFCISDILIVGGGKDNAGASVDAQGTTDTASVGGMQGTYKYRLTFKNSTTGNESDPSSATQVARDVNRGYVQLTNLPVSADSQVDTKVIYRTVGNGTLFFKIAEVANAVTSFDDEVADHDSLDATEGVAVMSNDPLRFDNAVPRADHDHCIFNRARAYWISSGSGQRGRVFFSPAGRVESQAGFIDVSTAGDPLHRLVVFNGIVYVYSEAKVYRIDEDSQGFILSKEISGVPGVQFAQRRTVTPTPKGVFWQATDGVRSFNGAASTLVNPTPLQKIFRGETAEGLGPFEGTSATFARSEYIISNDSLSLAIDINDLSWREVGYNDITSLFYEADTDKIVAGRTSNTQLILEEAATNDAGSAIPIEWETPAVDGPNDAVVIIERVFIDADTNGETIAANLINRFTTVSLGNLSTTAARETNEIEVQDMLLKPGVRLSGNVNSRVTVYDIELEMRNLELGINLIGGPRTAFSGRYREDLGANGTILFEIDPENTTFDGTDKIFVIDRVTVEADTNSTAVSVLATFGTNQVTLGTVNTSSRSITTFEVDRIGPLNELRLDGNFFSGTHPTIFRVEVHLRELTLGVSVTTGNERGEISGRMLIPTTSMEWEVQPTIQQFNNLGTIYWIERIVIEADTDGNSVTVDIDTPAGTIVAGTVNTTSRDYSEFSVERPGPVRIIRLEADFNTNAIELYSIELFLRPVNLGVQFRTGQRIVYDGKLINETLELIFDIDPHRQEVDGQNSVPLIEHLYLDMNSDSNTATPTLVTESGNIGLTGSSSATRATQVYDINRIGNITRVKLAADFTNAIALYGVELTLRDLPLNIHVVNTNRVRNE